MPVYELRPVDLNHSDWEASLHKGACRVYAPNEERAREYVDHEFRQAATRRSPYDDTPLSPWLNPARTECVTAGASASSDEYGTVEVRRGGFSGALGSAPLGTGPIGGGTPGTWTTINRATEGDGSEGLAPLSPEHPKTLDDVTDFDRIVDFDSLGDVDRLSDVEHLSDIGRDVEAEGSLREDLQSSDTAPITESISAESHTSSDAVGVVQVPPVSNDAIRRVSANRRVLIFQSTQLLECLDDLLGPADIPIDRRNAPSIADALGVSAAHANGELLTVLTELRDELRRFNEALENAQVQRPALNELQRIGLRTLNTFAQVSASGIAGLFVAGLGGVLDNAGVVSWEHSIEIIRAIRSGDCGS